MDYDGVLVCLIRCAFYPHLFFLAKYESRICNPHLYSHPVVFDTYGWQECYGIKEHLGINFVGGC